MPTRTILLQLALVAAMLLLPAFSTAGDHSGNGYRHGQAHDGPQRHGKRHNDDQSAGFTENSAYVASCGGCHLAYAPQLLPRASWERLLSRLDDHFGSAAALSDQEKSVVSDYLLANSADVTSMKLGRRITHSLSGTTPARITDIPYILHKHRSLSTEVLARKSVNSLANCVACHPGAASARFDDDQVAIPAP
ncbi:dihem cytochrome c [Desulfovibrio sp. TomC]|uniref:dihem cytochrome c n=1 Tax=Desulfovibrio sp. TomC TaxID=1562888 RepID=UPI0005739281|nr:dihem cytochrome c [Desulfovibrio sp. TomC]KHK00764.1 Diheme cytochrome c [Desulfovibrio sp. TomC]